MVILKDLARILITLPQTQRILKKTNLQNKDQLLLVLEDLLIVVYFDEEHALLGERPVPFPRERLWSLTFYSLLFTMMNDNVILIT